MDIPSGQAISRVYATYANGTDTLTDPDGGVSPTLLSLTASNGATAPSVVWTKVSTGLWKLTYTDSSSPVGTQWTRVVGTTVGGIGSIVTDQYVIVPATGPVVANVTEWNGSAVTGAITLGPVTTPSLNVTNAI